ncbi:hypothetical protein [Humidisolicoccus flavus]|uniref:hypothetical protein n=1 Tax=Humidisolicoccus flavus TaxID=3111414 RepID=UPI0032462C60
MNTNADWQLLLSKLRIAFDDAMIARDEGIVAAARAGVPTQFIAESVGLSIRKVARIIRTEPVEQA